MSDTDNEVVADGAMVPGTTTRSLWRNPVLWLAVCLLLSFAVLAYPVYVIRPFRHQGSRELAAALLLMRFRPFLEVALVVAGLALATFSWQRVHGKLRKIAVSLCGLLIVGFAMLSRVNIYELMFHPLDGATFSPAAKAKLDGDEEVLAIRVGSTARAYPIRSMSYHHIINDVVGGLPIVATY